MVPDESTVGGSDGILGDGDGMVVVDIVGSKVGDEDGIMVGADETAVGGGDGIVLSRDESTVGDSDGLVLGTDESAVGGWDGVLEENTVGVWDTCRQLGLVALILEGGSKLLLTGTIVGDGTRFTREQLEARGLDEVGAKEGIIGLLEGCNDRGRVVVLYEGEGE